MMRSNMEKEMMGYGGMTKGKKVKKMRRGGQCPMDGCCVRGKTKAKRK